jgi:hypothetical protein
MNQTRKDLLEQGFKTYSDLKGWEKSYIFLRMLVNKDRFGGLSDNPRKADRIVEAIYDTYKLQQHAQPQESVSVIFRVIDQLLQENGGRTSKKLSQFEHLIEVLKGIIDLPEDFLILAITIQELLIPTNGAVSKVPSADEVVKFARIYGKALLDEKKEMGLSTIIRDWDVFTEALALNKEREIIVELIYRVRTSITTKARNKNVEITDKDLDIILTGLCQEFERRTGQKRKQRAGDDLESVTQFIFNYYNLKASPKPTHFLSGLEVDTWLKDERGWYIGVSLKRTLRERWKQTFVSVDDMNRLKIKNVVHIINNDHDLSDSKLSEMAGHRHLFFLPDNSKILSELQNHIALGKHLFPMSEFIQQIKVLIEE